MNNVVGFFLALCLAVMPGGAYAAVCGADTENDISKFEGLKSAFLAADDGLFMQAIDVGAAPIAETASDLFGQLAEISPNGFSRCETIVQRREEPGFYQEVFVMWNDDPTTKFVGVGVYLSAVMIDGVVRVTEYASYSNLDQVFEHLY